MARVGARSQLTVARHMDSLLSILQGWLIPVLRCRRRGSSMGPALLPRCGGSLAPCRQARPMSLRARSSCWRLRGGRSGQLVRLARAWRRVCGRGTPDGAPAARAGRVGALRAGRHGYGPAGTGARSVRRFLSAGKQRLGVTSSSRWRASIDCEPRVVSRLLRPARGGSRWLATGGYAIARGVAISRARYVRSRQTCACISSRCWVDGVWGVSRVRIYSGLLVAGLPLGGARARSGRSSTPHACSGETWISSPATTMSCSSIRPAVYACRRVRGDANGSRPPMKHGHRVHFPRCTRRAPHARPRLESSASPCPTVRTGDWCAVGHAVTVATGARCVPTERRRSGGAASTRALACRAPRCARPPTGSSARAPSDCGTWRTGPCRASRGRCARFAPSRSAAY